MLRKYYSLTLILFLAVFIIACQEEEYSLPTAESGLHNDCIKRTLGPNVVGLNIEFAYAMALLPSEGKIVSAQVEASVAGASGTYLENKSYYTNSSGQDVGIAIGDASVTTGTKTVVTFTKDTCAATLRYYYIIPEEARGKSVSFTFSAKASNGQTVSYEMGPYNIAKMDMKLDLLAKDGTACYISIADMAVYDAAGAAANAAKIDLVYLYRSITGITFSHALVSPANTEYLPDIILPSGVNNSTKSIKAWNLRDQQLARLQYGVFIDDVDFQQIDFANAPNYAINMKAEAGLWVETADGKYRAYVFVNKVDNTKKEMTLSIKRLQMK
ncbi:MAG: DUF4466 domain-containing protein [Bacteroidetes bacterium GWF2_42_66]|nr:MAG: DUF4466 domain-containing protein [Bacteroidetes bacterium GWA2_42_15]OFY02079.1 MAG: DUF4466 domain-containing protein [Bacteroidetes bacterium GWE2_42_39]OFY43425.1 MAG: DUF4466 domain-containing protein [Bacteroidetes bacterium GWF2_42_66]HBL76510.1 DUF4466 domain-containing protein [Prolixibacteraceae bacterium]HCR90452.1 DUF4466 domain-containing protein [Prolixibacteraceae bacterium]